MHVITLKSTQIQYSTVSTSLIYVTVLLTQRQKQNWLVLMLGTVNIDVSVVVVIEEKWARVVYRQDPFLHL